MVIVNEAYMPMTLFVPDMTDEKFQEFCEEYSDFRLEYTAEGELIIMPPTDHWTSARNAGIVFQLMKWAVESRKGKVTESSGGFKLPNGSRRSPDAAWSSKDRFEFGGCPEFVIELLSPSDRPRVARDKMREWIANGAELGWMIDPAARTVTIFRPGQEPEVLADASTIAGEGPVAGFVLDLEAIWSI